MASSTQRPRGGFKRRIRLGWWLRDALAGGRITYSAELHREYKEVVKALDDTDGSRRYKGKRHLIKEKSFRNYFYWLHELGMIEYVGTEPSYGFKGTQGAERRLFRMVAGTENDPRWDDIQNAYRSSK